VPRPLDRYETMADTETVQSTIQRKKDIMLTGRGANEGRWHPISQTHPMISFLL
jgi:hypothetical protein